MTTEDIAQEEVEKGTRKILRNLTGAMEDPGKFCLAEY
jgi:hypothetical protein